MENPGIERNVDNAPQADDSILRTRFKSVLSRLRSNPASCSCESAVDWKSAPTGLFVFPFPNFCQALCQRTESVFRCGAPLSQSDLSYRFITAKSTLSHLCPTHRRQLQLHLICPLCGYFIETGKAATCCTISTDDPESSVLHLFHRECVQNSLNPDKCPHCCGNLDEPIDVYLHGIPKKNPVTPCRREVPVISTKAPVDPALKTLSLNCKNGTVFRTSGLKKRDDLFEMVEIIMELKTFGDEIPGIDSPLEKILQNDEESHFQLAQFLATCSLGTLRWELRNAFRKCILSGNLIAVHLFNCASINLKEFFSVDGLTPISLAALHSHMDLVKYLHSQDCPFDQPEALRKMLVNSERHLDVLRLLESGAVKENMLEILMKEESAPEFILAYAKRFVKDNTKVWDKFRKALEKNDMETACRMIVFDFEELRKADRTQEIKTLTSGNPKVWRLYQSKLNAAQSERVVCRDLSNGKERIPVKVIAGKDDRDPSERFVYTDKRILPPGIAVDLSVNNFVKCDCGDICDPASCACRLASCRTFDKDGLLRIENQMDEEHKGIFECHQLCQCSKKCGNRIVQKGVTCPLQIRMTKSCGWGLFTECYVPKGKFIGEYSGLVVEDSQEANRHQGHSYLFQLEGKSDNAEVGEESFCIDAGPKGNFARFLNHSCTPNLEPFWYYCEMQDIRLPQVVFFTIEDVPAGSQLCFDYGRSFWREEHTDFSCGCGSYSCFYRRTKQT